MLSPEADAMDGLLSVAVFAHNEAARIGAALESLFAAAEGRTLQVTVLANGCRDGTADIVRELARHNPQLQLLESALADKAEAWNSYVHQVAARAPASQALLHVFMDGDVQPGPGSLSALAAALALAPHANAAAALPNSGRDRDAWRRRMVANSALAGGLYALRGEFVQRLRARGVRVPRGFVGEDWLVSLFAVSDLQPTAWGGILPSRVQMAPGASFSFRPLSPWRPADYRVYLRRLWRYTLRGVQFELATSWLLHQPPETLPPDAEQLALWAPLPSRLKWVGWTSPLRSWAVQALRRRRARHHAKQL